MRLTINNICKGLAVVVLIVFIGPHIVSYFDRPGGDKSYHDHRRKVRHSDDDEGPNIDHPKNAINQDGFNKVCLLHSLSQSIIFADNVVLNFITLEGHETRSPWKYRVRR